MISSAGSGAHFYIGGPVCIEGPVNRRPEGWFDWLCTAPPEPEPVQPLLMQFSSYAGPPMNAVNYPPIALAQRAAWGDQGPAVGMGPYIPWNETSSNSGSSASEAYTPRQPTRSDGPTAMNEHEADDLYEGLYMGRGSVPRSQLILEHEPVISPLVPSKVDQVTYDPKSGRTVIKDRFGTREIDAQKLLSK